jgi:flavin-dependent dehydrogenase
MEYYDIVIIGAGIAGCGLAYNLNKECPEKKVLIIDKEEVGTNAAYGYRNTTEDVIKEYNLPYEHIYKGIKIGIKDKTIFTLNRKFYFIDYKKACKYLLKNSNVKFKKETAIKLGKNILLTNQNKYYFKILVDCSGNNFFARKQKNKKDSFRFWMGKTRILKNKLKDTDYFYFQFNNSGYFEDLYPMKNKTLQGDWQYTKKNDVKLIWADKNNLYNKYFKNPRIIQENFVANPSTPIIPIVYKNIVLLGDSFGNALASSGAGIKVILETSQMLTKSIVRKDLKSYENLWKKKYLNTYIKYLVSKLDMYNNPKIIDKIKGSPTKKEIMPLMGKYKKIFEKILDCDMEIKIPKEIKQLYSLRSRIFQIYFFFYLHLKYKLMK